MSIDNPWFTTRFSKEDYATVAAFRHGGSNYRIRRFEPLLLYRGGTVWQPDQLWTIGTYGVHRGVTFHWIECRTARWEFLEQVYAEAVAATEKRFPDLYDVRWVPCLPNWRELVLPDCYADAADFLEEHIRTIAARGSVRVDTSVQLRTHPSHQRGSPTERPETTIRLIVDVEHLSKSFTQSIMDRCRAGAEIEVPERRLTFAADDVAELVVRPTRRQQELLNHWDATPPPTDLEKEMIRAAANLDVDEVERLLDAGGEH